MAFYRCGGGSGIPSQVNTDMNNVLNKKFSTSGQTYPATEWAEDVNLLGLLEEKTTTSDSIAHITDGADGVPIKNWQVTLPASLSGYSAIGCNKGGANFIELYTRASHNGIDYSINADGSLHRDGTASGNSFNNPNATNYSNCPYKFKKGTYTLSVSGSGDNSSYTSLGIYLASGASFTAQGVTGNGTKTFTVTEDFGAWFYIKTNSGVTVDDNVYIWVSAGSTADAYTPYTAPTTATASLGRTIYGGTVDVVTGEGSADGAVVTLDDTMSYGINLGTDTNRIAVSFYNSVGKINGTFASNVLTVGENTTGGYKSEPWVIWGSTSAARMWISVPTNIDTVDKFKQYVQNNTITIAYELATATAFTFTPITPTPETPLGVSNWWADNGDSTVTYRSSGTVTPVPVVPTLISKTITENDTYYAEDDNADGYSEVIVNVQGGVTPFVPQFTETKIADNSSHASSFTLSEDYGNYDMVKIVWYESASSSGFLYTTPDILDEIFSIGVGKLCINKPSTNYYICYSKSGLTWTQTNQRNISVLSVYGVTFTNCTMTATDLYKRGASTTTRIAITSQTSLKDYDLFIMASIHATDGSETMPATWLYQYPPENMSGAFSCPVPTVLQEYNANDEAFVISEYGMTAARFFMVQGIVFTPNTSNLLSMGGLTSSNEEPTEPENNEEEEE